MQPAGFQCPECNVPLRLRDRSQIGREIDCPDCGARLRIAADAGEVRAVRAAEPIGLQLPHRQGSRSMLRLVWLATACLGAVIVWLASRPATPEAIVEKTDFEEAAPDALVAAPEPVVETPKVEPAPPAELPMLEPPKLPEPPPEEVAVVTADNRPIEPELAPDLPAVDVEAQLSLRIDEFSQTRPVQVRLLLRQIAELSAVPVDLSAVEKQPWKTKLDQQITVAMKTTTVQGILVEVLRQAGLKWQMQDEAITILPLD